MRELIVRLALIIPDDADDQCALDVLKKCIDVGLADAYDTCDDPDIDLGLDKDIIANMEVGDPEVDRLY